MELVVATSITRKKRSNKILSAVLTNVNTLQSNLYYKNDLIELIRNGLTVVNLELTQDNNILLREYDKNTKLRGEDLYYIKESYKDSNYITEHYIFLVSGYQNVYNVLISIPKKELKPLNIIGTVSDIKFSLKKENINYNNFAIYNGYYDKKSDKILYEGKECKFEDCINHKRLREIINGTCELLYCPYSNEYLLKAVKFNSTEILLPEQIKGICKSFGSSFGYYNLTIKANDFQVKSQAFMDDKQIDNININGSINVIHDYFACNSSLSSFNYEGEIQKVGMCAFKDCKKLKKTILNAKVIDKGAFYNSGLQTIRLYDCYKIKDLAFAECKNLKSVRAFDCEYIGEKAFYNCKNLETIHIPNVTIIGENAFKGCTSLKEVVINKNTEISKNAFESKNKINFKFN